MDLSKEFVLVTGADGFIGSHLVERLVKNGVKTKAFVYYNSFNSYGWLDTFDKKILSEVEIITGDVRDANSIFEAAKNTSVIFHLAALISIPFSYLAPDAYIDTNVKGTLNVLSAARRNNVRKIITTSTSEIYGTAQTKDICEKHPINPQSPYAASKAAADHFALAFNASFGLPVTVARPFNTFGPRQSGRAIIPTIITQLFSELEEINVGSLEPTRDFCFVADTVAGMIAIAESEKTVGEIINIGSGNEISIGEIINLLMEVMGKKVKVVIDQQRIRPANSEVFRLLANTEKIKKLTNWKPQFEGEIGFKRGLKETIEWFKNNAHESRYKPSTYNI